MQNAERWSALGAGAPVGLGAISGLRGYESQPMSKQERGSPLPTPPGPPNRWLAALWDDVNKVGAATVVAAWAATGRLEVPFVGLAMEAAYLLFVPESSWFRQRLLARQRVREADYRRRLHEQVLPLAGPEYQRVYEAMLHTREAIEKNIPPDEPTSLEMLRQLDYMLEKSSLFTYQLVQYRQYLARLYGDRGRGSTPLEMAQVLMAQADEQIARLRAQLQRPGPEQTRSVLEENIGVLQKKRELLERIATLSQNIVLHLQLFRNSFDLVGGLVQTRAPDEILTVINDAISKAELTATLGEQSSQIDDQIRKLRLDVMAQ